MSLIPSGQSRGLCDVNPGYEEGFLAPLTVGFLPGVKKPERQRLLDLNVRIIREVAAISMENMQMVFGRFGVAVAISVLIGIDNRPVQPPKRSPEVVEVEKLDPDSNDYFFLRARVFRLLAQGTRRLRSKGLRACRLVIEIRYSDYKDDRAQQRFTASDNEQDLTLCGKTGARTCSEPSSARAQNYASALRFVLCPAANVSVSTSAKSKSRSCDSGYGQNP